MRKVDDEGEKKGGRGKKEKIAEIVATNVMASQLPNWRSNARPNVRGKAMA